MRDYALVKHSFWTDGQTETRSADANYLLLYFLTCVEVNNVGVCETTGRRIALSMNMPSDRLKQALRELSDKRELISNEAHRFFIPCFIDRQIQRNKNSDEINEKMLKNLRSLYSAERDTTIQKILETRYPEIFSARLQPKQTNTIDKDYNGTFEALKACGEISP